jgi:hypothetical protein
MDRVHSIIHVQRYCSQTEYGALFTSVGIVHGGLFMEYCSRVTVHRVLGGGPRQICGAAPTMQRSAVRSARLAYYSSGGSFLKTGFLRWSNLCACLGDQRCCSPEIGDATGLETGYAVAVWRSSGVVGLEVQQFTS